MLENTTDNVQIGRKPAFNATILTGGVFACIVAGTNSFVGFSAVWALIGTAAGGNVPVDSMIFLGTSAWSFLSLFPNSLAYNAQRTNVAPLQNSCLAVMHTYSQH